MTNADATLRANFTEISGNLITDGDGVSDVDNNFYPTVIIGTQEWMAENLKVTKFNDGADIPLVINETTWANLTTPGYCWYNHNDTTHKDAYGALYNWYAIDTNRLCPSGWHIPSEDEQNILINHLGGESIAGGKLKKDKTNYWKSPNVKATNITGFGAQPGGSRYENGKFYFVTEFGYWWSSSELAWPYYMHYNNSGVGRTNYGKRIGLSVRCIKS